MSALATHPRRRPARPSDATSSANLSLVDSFQSMSIRKGDTYHTSNEGKSAFWDPLEKSKTPTNARSTTSPKSLEDLLLGAGDRQVAELMTRVDKAVADKSQAALTTVLSEPEVLPVPTFTVNDVPVEGLPQKLRTRHHSHSSDSGIGSSIADSTESRNSAKKSSRIGERHQKKRQFKFVHTTFDANSSKVTRAAASSPGRQSFSSISDADEERGLSEYAAKQIKKHIVDPILKEESLSDFHDLIKDVPKRIGEKDIKNLRDLEKTLIFLAPDHSRSPAKYLQFCERTIRVLHNTVTTLHESDQRAPTDRPYTQGYFFDLVEQIRRYATILAATRARQARGEKLDAMDVTGDERITLHGGVSHNGKAPELVRHTVDGKVISLATGEQISEEELASASTMKRPAEAEVDDDDDDVLRSMARRKKNAKPEIHGCSICDKEFKRPCDLTKHIKTHERPWKCPDEDCKYHESGWPTEKERDRHVNDKHSSAPALYHCLYKPCPYTSKRESNCKQHMEKAHGWNYVRSKSNGKGRAGSGMHLHQGSIPPSPSSAMLGTPLTPIAPSPSNQSWSESSARGSMPPPPTAGPSSYNSTPSYSHPSPAWADHFNMDFDFNNMVDFPTSAMYPMTPALSEDRRASGTFSSTSGLQFDGSSFDDASPHDLDFPDFKFSMDDFKIPPQQYTPNSSVAGPSSAAHTSPGALVDQTFTYDPMNLDGQYSTGYPAGPTGDFTLYGAAAPVTSSGEMFPSLAENNWHSMNMGTEQNFGNAMDMSHAPTMPSGTTSQALDELFPELRDTN